MADTKLEEGLALDGRLLLIAQIGRGGQAAVWKVRELDGAKRELAAKLVVVPNERRAEISEEVIDGEIQKLRVLSSNFIVIMHYAIYALMEDTGDIVVGYTMPLASGTLQDDDYRKTLRTNRDELFDTMWSVGQGISTIHYNNFVHGDIKPSNVLLFTERGLKDLMSVRVSDLGAAYLASLGFGVAFDPRYAAPERFKSQYETATTYDKKKSDIYSLALLYFELMTGKYAYGDNLHFEFPFQDFHRVHESYSIDWELVPKTYGGLVETLQKMVDKNPETRPDIADVIKKLEATRSVVQVETTQGHRKAGIFFPPNVFIWNPRLHRKFQFRKKIFFIRSPRPFDLAREIRSTLRKDYPRRGVTLYVAFGSADIILMIWELEKQDAIAAAIKPLIQLAQGTIEVYVVENVIYRDSREQETWEREPPNDLARRIATHTAPEIEKALASGQDIDKTLEPWLKKQRLVFNRLMPVAQHGMVRLLLKVEANRPMAQEHDTIVASMLKFLKTHYSQAGGRLPSYPYRVYRDVTASGDWGSVKNKYLFAELYGRNIYLCSSAVLGLINSIGLVAVPSDQYFLFSSHIQFDQQNIPESEDGALSEILSNAGPRESSPAVRG
jgi:serine/threonine protein kinase